MHKNDRIKALKYRKELENSYGIAIFSKSRKRENVLIRRMIVTFLVKEKKFKECFVAKIFNVTHAAVFYFMKPIIDKEFDRFYKINFDALKENFEKIETHVISS
ncbi:hypothetical protein ACFQO9_11160 [Chryseobacterium zhengzhouense]|uniref:Transposase n=1 Tax=Chryseobacterium zhengzhouense TaxID=1636086 RepID=A0ABW2M0H8_9FLAO